MARREHPRFPLRQGPDRPLRRLPVPGRLPRRAREALPSEHHTPDGVQVDRQDVVARHEHAVDAAQVRDVPRVCPGAGMYSQSGSPGTPPPAGGHGSHR
jgi:hypothetical protein